MDNKMEDFNPTQLIGEPRPDNVVLEEISAKLDYLPIMDQKITSFQVKRPSAIAQFWDDMSKTQRSVFVGSLTTGILSVLHVNLDAGLQGAIRLLLLGAGEPIP